MPSGNAIRIATNQAVGGGFTSAHIQLQGVREEAVVFWVHVQNPSGAMMRIRGAPEDAAHGISATAGALLHTVITSGTAASRQTKVDTDGHAVVTLQVLPQMWIVWTGGLGTDILNCWIIE